MAAPLKLGIAGLGTVGASVVRLVTEQRDALIARCGRPIEVVAVSARSRGKKRDIDLRKLRWWRIRSRSPTARSTCWSS